MVVMVPETADRIKSLMRENIELGGGKGLSLSSEQVVAADADNDGALSESELRMLADADADQDGRLSPAEELTLMSHARSGGGKSLRLKHQRKWGNLRLIRSRQIGAN